MAARFPIASSQIVILYWFELISLCAPYYARKCAYISSVLRISNTSGSHTHKIRNKCIEECAEEGENKLGGKIGSETSMPKRRMRWLRNVYVNENLNFEIYYGWELKLKRVFVFADVCVCVCVWGARCLSRKCEKDSGVHSELTRFKLRAQQKRCKYSILYMERQSKKWKQPRCAPSALSFYIISLFVAWLALPAFRPRKTPLLVLACHAWS